MFVLRFRSFEKILKLANNNVVNGQITLSTIPKNFYCTAHTEQNTPKDGSLPKKSISKAMKAYLERAREHNEFMEEKKREFEIGKRHLANMMGEDPEMFTQKDIDEAIAYLFPSGLYDPKARPFMKPPEEVYPQRKAAEFDESGRPYHFLFYTGRPNFYNILYDVVEQMEQLEKFEDKMIRNGAKPDPNLKLDLYGFKWLDKEVLEKKIVEPVNDKEYDYFTATMDRLVNMPYSYRIKDFVMKYCQSLVSQTKIEDIPKLKYDQDGRAYITVYECLRKRARGDVTIRSPGTGQISINGEDIRYFEDIQCREQVSQF